MNSVKTSRNFITLESGKRLSDTEKVEKMAYKKAGTTNVVIAKDIGRSETVIENFLKKGSEYGKYKNSGRKPTLNQKDKRRVVTAVSKRVVSANEIIRSCGLNLSWQTIYRIVSQSGVIKRQKMKTAPKLLDRHKVARKEFARKHMATDRTNVSTNEIFQLFQFLEDLTFQINFADEKSSIWMVLMDSTITGEI